MLHFENSPCQGMIHSMIPRATVLDSDFREYLSNEYPVHKAARQGRDDVLKYLIDCGHNVNTGNFDLIKPLHEACLNGHVTCVEILLSAGAEVNARNIDGSTPLCDASCHGNVECIRLLLEHGADVNPSLILVTSPLHEAVIRGHHKVTQMLIDAGANVDATDNHFGMPLHVAAYKGYKECAHLLLCGGANVNVSKIHHTPLHDVARHEDLDFLRLMLEAGANPWSLNNHGLTATDLTPPDSPARKLLRDWQVLPRSLSYWCRKTVRRTIGIRQLQHILRLPIPPSFKDHLLFRI